MSRRPWYKRYPSDFLMSTSDLTVEEKGAYSVIIDLIFDRVGPIPNDPKWFGRVAGCSTLRARQLFEKLLQVGKISVTDDGHLTNARAEAMAAELQNDAEMKAQSGAKGGRKHAENLRKPAENNDLTESSLEQYQKPETRKKEDSPSESPGARANSAHGTRLPADWRPSHAGIDAATDAGLDPEAILPVFRDYWHSVPGQKGRKTDWEATWRNWCRREAEHRSRPPQRPRSGELPLLRPVSNAQPVDPNDKWGIDAWCKAIGAEPYHDDQGRGKWKYAGRVIDSTARRVAEAAGFSSKLRPDWSPLKAWIDDQLHPGDQIIPAIEKLAQYFTSRGQPAMSLKAFDKAVREGKAA